MEKTPVQSTWSSFVSDTAKDTSSRDNFRPALSCFLWDIPLHFNLFTYQGPLRIPAGCRLEFNSFILSNSSHLPFLPLNSPE